MKASCLKFHFLETEFKFMRIIKEILSKGEGKVVKRMKERQRQGVAPSLAPACCMKSMKSIRVVL